MRVYYFGKRFLLNDETLPVVEEIGRHMPGGFFIYKAAGEELLYVNRAAMDIYGCADLDEFKELTGYTFSGMVYHEDYDSIASSISHQIESKDDKIDFVEYRIVRKDGTVRWVEDYGHYTETDAYGGIYYVFISDITEKKEQLETDKAVRQAVIEALGKAYHTMWVINDVEAESFSLYRGDTDGDTVHAAPIHNALGHAKFSVAIEEYIKTRVAESDRARLRETLVLKSIVNSLEDCPLQTTELVKTTMKENFPPRGEEEILPAVKKGTALTGDNYWKGIYGHVTANYIANYYKCPDPYMVTEMEEVAVASTAECFVMLDRVISLRVIVNEGEFN